MGNVPGKFAEDYIESSKDKELEGEHDAVLFCTNGRHYGIYLSEYT